MWFLLACTSQLDVDAPECTDEEIVSCPAVELARSCNQMFVIDGLTVRFDGFSFDSYDAVLTLDGTEIPFSCAADTPSSTEIWQCDSAGFHAWGWADEIDLVVTGPDTSYAGHFTPCWDANEANGRCCGWSFSAEVVLSADTGT